ncbi:IS4 family transposase [Tengunoibacter tsumagoiensis]|uniref:Transposase IS4-like domain-containing protein n=1 Tax=Tengunoibacter tsumagoiensis TaxID=2014871 RepID=A0A401ZVR6_9CHLR|nr:IS4 family transposase [Tengunoibacter tsumagoiensis]GCE10999.1 hypothetical protein KTT_08580 [Tengunoibacter tsumagoiensis]GCE12800.1 hypothetical protein KTT_26590 [Tengunoibacter tsumagoiensis]
MIYDTPSGRELVKSSEPTQALETLLIEASRDLVVPGKRRGRPQRLSSCFLFLGILICMLRGWNSQLDLWRLLSFSGVGTLPPVRVSDQAIYKRLAQNTHAHFRAFFEQMSAWLCERMNLRTDLSLAPFATDVFALDESTLDPRKRWIAELRQVPIGDRRLLAGRIGALFDVRRQQWKRIDVFNTVADCRRAAFDLISGIPAGALILFDRGYNGFEWFDELTTRRLWWIGRVKKNMSYKVLHVISDRNGIVDALVQVGAFRADQARYTARLVRYWYRGQWYEYLTNVTDARQLSVAQIARLYDRRWDIECAFRLLKDYLGLKWLWSAKWEVIQVQIWATALLAQFFHAYQMHIADKADIDVFDVSLELLVRHVPRWLAEGYDPIEVILSQGRAMKMIRPSTRSRRELFHVPVEELCDPPDDLPRERKSRYAHKAAGNFPRKKKQES